MSIGYTIRPDPDAERALLRALQRAKRVGGNLRQPLQRIGLFVRREARDRLGRRKRDWGRGPAKLGQSLTIRVTETSVTVGSNLVYARIQQLGGVVKPKTVKYLAIPVKSSLRRLGQWPRDFPKGALKFVPNAKIKIGTHSWTGPALVGKRPRGPLKRQADGTLRDQEGRFAKADGEQRDEVLFALVKKVTIKGRPYLVFEADAKRFALDQFEQAYRRALRGN